MLFDYFYFYFRMWYKFIKIGIKGNKPGAVIFRSFKMNNIIDIAEKIHLAGKQAGFGYNRTINIAFTIFNEKTGFIIDRFTIQLEST